MTVTIHNLNLVEDYLLKNEFTSAFQRRDPYSPTAWAGCYEHILARSDYDRVFLSESFSDYNKIIGNDSLALSNCNRLKEPRSVAVVTGQQAGMLTGPLYTVYKIITAINFAKRCETQFKTPVVPVFWNATEDHDLSEVEAFHYPDKTWTALFRKKGVAAQYLGVNPACSDLVQDFLNSISEINHKKEITSIITNDFESYGEFSSSVIARLFKGTGLIIIEPKLLREKSVSFFKKGIELRQDIRNCLQQTGEVLQKNKIPPTFNVTDDSTGLFYLNDDGVRYQIKNKDDNFFLNDNWVSKSSICQEIMASPTDFSTGAYLRPVLQSKIIPTLAYIAGPAEYKYHLQLDKLFDLFDVNMPIILPRNHGTILTHKEIKTANKLGLTIDDYFLGPQSFYHQQKLNENETQGFLNADRIFMETVENLYCEMPDLINKNRKEKFKSVLSFQLEKLEKQVTREFLRRGEIDNARIDRFFSCVFPKNSMQERLINIFYFIEQNGLSIISDLLEIMDPLECGHYVIQTDR